MDILATVEDLQKQYAAADTLLKEATEQLTSANAAIDSMDAALSKAASELAAKSAELQAANDLIASLKAEAKSADDKALELVARQGIVPPKVSSGQSAAKTRDEVLAQYASISDPMERGQFYADHRALILGL